MEIQGAIFDFDGTLFDSMEIWRDLGERYLRHLGIEAGEEISALFFNSSTRSAILAAKEKFSMNLTEAEIASGLNDYLITRYLADSEPKEGVIELLEKMKNAGIKMCIATATDKVAVSAALRKYDMLKYFDEIFSVSTVGKSKEHPDIFRAARAFMGTEKDKTWVFEDALYSAKTVKADGFPLVGVYDKSEEGRAELEKLADVYIEKYEDLNLS